MIEFRVLGSFEAVDGDRRLALGGFRQLVLLAALLVRRGQLVSSDRLIDDLWGERPPATARKIVHGYVSNLRKVLGDRLLVTQGRGYVLVLDDGQVDIDRFEDGVAEGRGALAQGDFVRAGERLGAALALWRGPALADFADEAFAQAECRRLEEERLTALEDRISADLEVGRHAAVVAELESLVCAQPLRESLHGQLMLALYRCGRQADALEVYQRARANLTAQLGLEPGPTLKALQRQILEQAATLEANATGGIDRLRRLAEVPQQATPTIGREREIVEVSRLLGSGDARLVVLTGPGGVGKTRLALEVVHTVRATFGDGVCWVELAGVARPDDVASTVARATGVTPLDGESARDALRRQLGGQRLLLAIDNFEHVVEAADLIAELHGTCPELTLLVTSRETLNLRAEHRVIVAPLPVPARETSTVSEIESIAGSALFLAAARRRNSRFVLGAAAVPALARVCARLDGLPLALELAAARTAVLSIEELAERLEDGMTDLGIGTRDAPDRQRTLDATIEWSYGMLDAQLQRAFVNFAVFAGGATLTATLAVTGIDLETIEALIAKSLIYRRQQSGAVPRLLMLETIRQYALVQLAADPERQEVHRRHCQHYLDLAEQTVPRLSTRGEQKALAILDAEIDNIRRALQWALQAAPQTSLRLAGQLGRYWRLRPHLEGLKWLETALQAAGEHAPVMDRARARLHHANQLSFRSQGAASIEGLRAAAALYRQADDHAGISETMSSLAVSLGVFAGDLAGERRYALQACRHARIAGDNALLGRALGKLAAVSGDQRRAILEQATDLLLPLGDYREIAVAYSNAAYMFIIEGNVAEATNFLETALHVVRNVEDPLETTIILSNIGLARLFSSDLDGSQGAFEHALRLCVQHVLTQHAGEGLAGLAAIAAAQSRDARAARLRGAARGLGYPPATLDNGIDDRLERDYLAPARTRHGDIAWRDAEQAGARLSWEQASAYALGERSEPYGREVKQDGSSGSPPPPSPPSGHPD